MLKGPDVSKHEQEPNREYEEAEKITQSEKESWRAVGKASKWANSNRTCRVILRSGKPAPAAENFERMLENACNTEANE